MHAGRHLIVTSKLRKMPLRLPLAFNDKSSNIYWMVSTFSKFYGKIYHALMLFHLIWNFFCPKLSFDLKVEHQNSFSRQNFNVENNYRLFVLSILLLYTIVSQCTWTKLILGTYLFLQKKFWRRLFCVVSLKKFLKKQIFEKQSSIFVWIMQQFCIILLGICTNKPALHAIK